MCEFSLPPSPNWYTCSGITVSDDGFVLYPSCANGISILEPINQQKTIFNVQNIYPAHKAKVTCISLSPEWMASRLFVSSGDDGQVKLWNAETLSTSKAHNLHQNAKDTIAGVIYLTTELVVSVGNTGLICLWNIKFNNVKSDSRLLKTYKPSCVSKCLYKDDIISIGTKTGVILVLSVENDLQVLFKVHGHDAEITSISWCPTPNCPSIQSTNLIKHINKPKIKEEPVRVVEDIPKQEEQDKIVESTPNSEDSFVELENPNSSNAEIDVNDESIFDIYEEHSFEEFGHSKNIYGPSGSDTEKCKTKSKMSKEKTEEKEKEEEQDDFLAECNKLKEMISKPQNYDDDDSDLDETTVINDSDIFDRFKDVSFEEFGHSKKSAKNLNDTSKLVGEVKLSSGELNDEENLNHPVAFLEECRIQGKKVEAEDSISSVQEQLESLSIDNSVGKNNAYFASGCKLGKICIWRWNGSLVASTNLNSYKLGDGSKKFESSKSHPWVAVHWMSSSVLLMARNVHLLKCDFSKLNMKTKKFNCLFVHDKHYRGLYSISSQVETENTNWRDHKSPVVWTIGQDRYLVGHDLNDDNCVARYTTFGGYVYNMAVSPIDSSRIAIAVGDGTIRIWERLSESNDDIKHVWNGIQGRIRSICWHPNKEQCLAYATTEGRVGILHVNSTKSPKILPPGLTRGVYQICWGSENKLFACGSGELVLYNTNNPKKDCEMVKIVVQEQKWAVSTIACSDDLLTIGSSEGAVGLFTMEEPFQVIATSYPHKKSIQHVEWHPKAVLSEDGSSPYENLLAVSATALTIVVLQYSKTDQKFEQYAQFSMHNDKVRNISWNTHYNAQLLSVSDDCSIQIWDVANKSILHTIVGHHEPVLCAFWCPMNPQRVISGGEDHTVRIWDITKYPPENLAVVKKVQKKKIQMASVQGEKATIITTKNEKAKTDEQAVDLPLLASVSSKKKTRHSSCLAIVSKQIRQSFDSSEGCRRLFKWMLETSSENGDKTSRPDYSGGYDYLRIYGSRDDVLELLDLEIANHNETLNWLGWCLVKMLTGDLKSVFEKAIEKNKLTPSLMALAPFISLRFWKETMTSYTNQLKHLSDKDLFSDTIASSSIWNCLILLLSNSLDEACDVFIQNGNLAEALCAIHTRHANHLVNKCLNAWSEHHMKKQHFIKAAECYLALGRFMEAAVALGKSNNEVDLLLAADIANHVGNSSLAEGIKNHANLK